MRGRFTANAGEMNGASAACCPAFNHNNIKRLRAEIKLVSVRDFLRFSFAWQHVAQTRITGRKAFDAVLAQQEGFEAPAAAWGKRNTKHPARGL